MPPPPSALALPLVGWWSRGKMPSAAGWGGAALAVCCPLIIPADRVALRAVAAVLATDLAFKMIDFCRHHPRGWDGGTARAYRRFLIPWPVFSVVYPAHKRQLAPPDRPGSHVGAIIGGTVGVVGGLGLARILWGSATPQSSPALEHGVRLLIFVPTVECVARVLYGIEHLTGCDTTLIVRNAYRSRTVAEFWRRYNDRVHDWLRRNVFQATGGRHHPARSTLLVFLASGLFHEAAFALATSRLTGYQFAFFAIQGPAVLASGKLERLARRRGIAGKILAHGVTILFLAVTSVLFFHGVSQIFPAILGRGSLLP